MHLPRILFAAGASGSGKTVAACGVMAAFAQKGLAVAAGKCGPDYIDPLFHRACLGIPSRNLDLFFVDRETLRAGFGRYAAGADITVVEGVMGYYDGLSLDSFRASSYDVADALNIPVILVVPCKGMARSVLPGILGMLAFCENSHIRGILLNRISPGLYPSMKEMIETELSRRGFSVPVVGFLPEREEFYLKSRHLGLAAPDGAGQMKAKLERMGTLLAETVDLDLLLQIGEEAPDWEEPVSEENHLPGADARRQSERSNTELRPGDRKDPIRVALAWDEAFCFYYEENLEMLRELGCEIIPFSPLRDTHLPADVSGLLLGGGYPELYARRLSENHSMRRAVRLALQGGLPCIAECGGFLYLQDVLEDEKGTLWPMAGVRKGKGFSVGKSLRFGYIRLCARTDGAYLLKGEEIRGHEFHYWDSEDNGKDCLAVKPGGKRSWECVHMEGSLFAGFPHLFFPSHPAFAQRFAEKCRVYQTCMGKIGGKMPETSGLNENF